MTTKTYGIQEIAAEFDRLFGADADLVDDTEISWGYGTEAGHVGHEGEESSIVGWYCQGGNVGHPVLSIRNEDLQRAWETLARMRSAKSMSDIKRAFASMGISFEQMG